MTEFSNGFLYTIDVCLLLHQFLLLQYFCSIPAMDMTNTTNGCIIVPIWFRKHRNTTVRRVTLIFNVRYRVNYLYFVIMKVRQNNAYLSTLVDCIKYGLRRTSKIYLAKCIESNKIPYLKYAFMFSK